MSNFNDAAGSLERALCHRSPDRAHAWVRVFSSPDNARKYERCVHCARLRELAGDAPVGPGVVPGEAGDADGQEAQGRELLTGEDARGAFACE